MAEEQRRQRIAQAETERQQRVAEQKDARDRQSQAEAEARREEARLLLPSPEGLAEARERLTRRARDRFHALVRQLGLFVVLPTILVVGYLAFLATPFYEARSVVAVTRAASDSSRELGSILPGLSGGARLNEAFQAYEFIRSQALMDRLEDSAGTISAFSSDRIDPLRRLRDAPFLGLTKRDLFDAYVLASIDIQSGLIKLRVRAPSAEESVQLSRLVIELTAAQINQLANELFAKRISEAEAAVAMAREQLREAQSAMTGLQIESGEIDPQARIEGILAGIDRLTLDAQTLRGEIEGSEVAGIGDTNQADRLRKREELLNQRITSERERLVGEGPNGEPSLNELLLTHELAALDIRIAQETLTTALHAAEQTRKDAALGRNVFQMIVPPAATESPMHPNITRSMLLSFLMLLGTFAFVKLTLLRT